MKYIFSLLLLTGCVTRKEVLATVWLNNLPLPAEVCAAQPSLNDYGIYRKLNNGKLEFVSVCNPVIRDFITVHKDDFNRILDSLLPEKRK